MHRLLADQSPGPSPAKSSRRDKSRDDKRFVTIYMGPVGGESSTAIIPVPDSVPKRQSAVFRYLNEARYLRNQHQVVLDFFRAAKKGMAKEELKTLTQRVKKKWDSISIISVISEKGSEESEGSGHQSLFERMRQIKKMVSEEVNQIRRRLSGSNASAARGSSPAKEPMDLHSFTAKYENKVLKVEVTLSSYIDSLDQFQEELKDYPQTEKESNLYIDLREKRGDPIHHKMTIHEGLVQRVESITAAALLILKSTAKIEAKLKERNPVLYAELVEKKKAVPPHKTLQLLHP